MSAGPPSTSDPPAALPAGPLRAPRRPLPVPRRERRTAPIRPRRGRVAPPAITAGVGLALSLPPWGIWVLAFPAAGLLFWRLGGLPPRTRLWAGWLAGLGCYVPGLAWARSFTLPGALVLMAVEAAFVAVACLAVPGRLVAARALAFPGALTLAEWARMNWPFGGLPIGGVFLGQAGGPVLGVARLGGPLALTAAVYVGGVGLACLVDAAARILHGSRRPRAEAWAERATGHGAAALAAVLALAAVVGVTVWAGQAPDGGPAVATITGAAVQGGGVRGYSKSQVDPAVVRAAQFSATRHLQQTGPVPAPRLVLWPEDVVSLDTLLADSPVKDELAALARSLHATLVVGVTETVSSTSFRNEVVAFGPDGAVVSHYEKVHRVPFGEYVPFRGFFSHIADLSAVPLDAIPGTGTGLLPTPAGPLGAMVSYEVFYADRGRSAVRHGAQLLIVPTNTSSYATSQIPSQEVAAARIQAVQQGRDLLQAAPTGYSAAITNHGAVLRRSVLGARQVVVADLALRTGLTVYARAGNLPVLLLAMIALVVGWLLAWRGLGGSRPDFH